MTLPGAEHAVIEIEKLRDYCLNADHPRGKHKARVFRSALEVTKDDADELRQVIAIKVLQRECIATSKDEYGQRFVVDFDWERAERNPQKSGQVGLS
ncbi:MAG TPA: hypothetical protein VMN36_08720 [Verrucomicrobiales bacterium]|nr:hypothetical protein [Verrucomicrobiales bacterium]